ncbi:arsenic resistance N-acetyltransferase ArsN2 (plasmid) [Deinococcus radiomollis]|uniref:arsenic resistance N-acetyltransferase ArsN2 n=1 Tax=Deinococcus radiomollis TaxID=468916 RepID=UPI0038917842
MLTRRARPEDWPDIEALLLACHLPLDGAREHLNLFRVGEEAGQVRGVAGLEVHGNAGLLRSVATSADHRSRGVAAALVRDLLQGASEYGLTSVSLLTTTARRYFERLGFEVQPRADSPPALQASLEFQGACPKSATFMSLSIHQEPTMTQTIPGLEELTTTLALRTEMSAGPQRPLEFWLHDQPLVGPGYHVTEVKAVTIEAMDCGGKAASWRETVIQLMDGIAEEAASGFMTNRKFLAIYNRVTSRIPVRDEAEVRFEYGNDRSPALQYHVGRIEAKNERVIVHLQTPGVQCKAGEACGLPSEASSAEEGCASGSGCCSPAPVELMTLG